LDSNQQGIHDVRQGVCRTKLHALRDVVDEVEPVGFHPAAIIIGGDAIILGSSYGAFSSPESQIDS
jgi:hypothetical protein